VTPVRVSGAAALGLALASAAYQAAGEARDRRRYPPPGRLVDIGGHRLHIRCAGEGTPTVVIIPALGGDVADWLTVQDALALCTAVCVYDRAGLGWSDAALRWPTAEGMARELHGLLNAAEISPPFVIAGHSLGGLVARVFTRLYPDEVAGLALVDSSHPDQAARRPRVQLRDYPGGKLAVVALRFARPLGLRRLMAVISREEADDGQVTALALSSRVRRAVAKEVLTIDAICRQTGRRAGHLGNLPLVVITSSERDPGQPEGSRAQRQRSLFYPGWSRLQDDLARLSANSIHVVASNAGHQVQRDDPELVVKTIAGLLRRLRET
jgi:pimeloyl-ACP methyl ester carboxylesterase